MRPQNLSPLSNSKAPTPQRRWADLQAKIQGGRKPKWITQQAIAIRFLPPSPTPTID